MSEEEFVKNVGQLILDIYENINEPEIIRNYLEGFQDENVEVLQLK